MKLIVHIIHVFSALVFLFLFGCASTPEPPVAVVSLNVQSNINPYSDGVSEPEARPLVIRMYELKSLAAFNTTDFFSVFNNYNQTLGTELLNSEEFQLLPGAKLKFDRTLDIDTRYIGIVSAFRDLEHSQWRSTTLVPQDESAPEIYVLLKGNQALVGAKRECGFLCRLWSPIPPEGSLYEVIEDPNE